MGSLYCHCFAARRLREKKSIHAQPAFPNCMAKVDSDAHDYGDRLQQAGHHCDDYLFRNAANDASVLIACRKDGDWSYFTIAKANNKLDAIRVPAELGTPADWKSFNPDEVLLEEDDVRSAIPLFIIATALLMLATPLYLVPTIMACSRKHRNTAQIAVINIFLGWTLLGWVASLLWSFNNNIKHPE